MRSAGDTTSIDGEGGVWAGLSPRQERFLSVICGANVLLLAGLDLWRGGGFGWSPTSICVFALGCVAGLLFLRREPARRHGGWLASLRSAPAVLIGGWALARTPDPRLWPAIAVAAFVAGTVVTGISLANLGRSFAVLPGRRPLVTRGPYRWLRHPAYAGELLMLAGCWWARPDVLGSCLLAAAPLLFAWRIREEEKLLAGDPGFAAYRRRVPWRLLPGVW